jgi:hypothetical protein
MIKINSLSPHIYTAHSATPYIGNSGYASNAPAGQVWWDTTLQCLKVSDGNTWFTIQPSVDIGLSRMADEAIEWAHRKMREEQELEELMKEYPGLKDAKQQFDVMLALVREYKD